jgi:hypothetical protein
MKDGSSISNPKAAPPDPARADGSWGFVPAAEIRNVWVEAIRRLDQELWPARAASGAPGPAPAREMIIEFVEDLQFKLLTRASANLDKVLGKVAPKPKVDEAAMAMSAAAQAAHYARMAKHRG